MENSHLKVSNIFECEVHCYVQATKCQQSLCLIIKWERCRLDGGPSSSGANRFGKQKSSNTLELRLSHKGGTQRVFLLLNSVDNVAIL